jgi:hypothetical protein
LLFEEKAARSSKVSEFFSRFLFFSENLPQASHRMKVRFTIYPAEIGMEPIYERVFALHPNQRATPIKRLLGYLSNNPTLPAWFTCLPAVPITTYRQQTIRLSLTSRDPDLIAIAAELEPLSEAERINYIKRMFAKACAPQSSDQQSAGLLDQPGGREEAQGVTAETAAPTSSDPTPSPSPTDLEKGAKIRSTSASMFRRTQKAPHGTNES